MVHIISVGSRIPELQALVICIFKLALISIKPELIPREFNALAVYVSKIMTGCWIQSYLVCLTYSGFVKTVDKFASSANAQLPIYSRLGDREQLVVLYLLLQLAYTLPWYIMCSFKDCCS